MTHHDPQAALLTPLGEGGIGIIALSGAGAAGVLELAFRGTRRAAGGIPPGAVAHGTVWAHTDGRVVLSTSSGRRARSVTWNEE